MKNNKPTSSQVETLMSDWMSNLHRDPDGNHVHKGEGGIRASGGQGTVDYLVGDVDDLNKLELIKRSRQAARDVVSAVIHGPCDVHVGGTDSNHIEKEGVHVVSIASDFFDDRTLSAKQQASIMLGLASHEAAHGVFTDNKVTEANINKGPKELLNLRKDIWNLIEDERIEYLLGDENPGLAPLLGETKKYYFKILDERERTNGQRPTEPLPRLISTIYHAIRYPSQMDREDIIENFDRLDAVRHILTPYPLTPQGAWDAADQIMDIIKDMMSDDKNEEEKDSNKASKNQSGQGEKDVKNDAKTVSNIEKALQTEQAKNVLEAIKKDIEKGSANNASMLLSSQKATEYVNDDSAEAEFGGSGMPERFVLFPEGDVNEYTQSLNRIRMYIPAMSKALACKTHERDYVLRGMPSGRLNPNKLASLATGRTTIFTKAGHVTTTKTSVCLLIDESASMNGKKQKAARDAAVLVKEAVDRIQNVEYFCYGYTSNLINVYAERGHSKKWALGSTQALTGTPTGDSMKITSGRIRRMASGPVLFLVLTDGAADSAEKVIRQEALMRSDKFVPVGVGILSGSIRNTFKDSIVLQDMSRFAVEIGMIVRGKLEKMIQKQREIY